MESIAYNIDCMDYMRSLPDKAFDLAVVDPPYGGGNSDIGGGIGSVGCLTDTRILKRTGGAWAKKYGKKIIGWDEAPGEDYFKELFRVSRYQIIWGANYFHNMPPTRCFLVWRKLTISESFSMAMCEYAWTSFSGNAKLFECAPQGSKEKRFHPTQKPVALYSWILKNFAKPGDRILDTHLGSGSSRIAAYRLGFDFVGCELDREYYEKQEERFRRECLGETVAPDGKTYKQLEIF